MEASLSLSSSGVQGVQEFEEANGRAFGGEAP
jgi:hypothetical protein